MMWKCASCGVQYNDLSGYDRKDLARGYCNRLVGVGDSSRECSGVLIPTSSKRERPADSPDTAQVADADLSLLVPYLGISRCDHYAVHLRPLPPRRGQTPNEEALCGDLMLNARGQRGALELCYPTPHWSTSSAVCISCLEHMHYLAKEAKRNQPDLPIEVERDLDPVQRHVEQLDEDGRVKAFLSLARRILEEPDAEWLLASFLATGWTQAKAKDGGELRYITLTLLVPAIKADPALGYGQEKGESELAMEARFKNLELY